MLNSSEFHLQDTGQKERATVKGARKETWLSLVLQFKELLSAIELLAPLRRPSELEHRVDQLLKRRSLRTTWMMATFEYIKDFFLTLKLFKT